jgi:hypothetical protein
MVKVAWGPFSDWNESSLDLFKSRIKIVDTFEGAPYVMRELTRRFLCAIATVVLVSAFGAGASAQRNPTMPSQQSDSQKDELYATFSELKKVSVGEKQRLAYEAGKEYLRRYGADSTDPDVKVVRKFVGEYEKVRGEFDIDTAYGAKNYVKTFEIGRAVLQKQPENFYVLSIMAQAGYESSITGNATLNADTVAYAKRAIQLLNDGKVIKADPFKSIEVAIGFLNYAVGNLLKDQSPVEAAAAFLKAVKSDSPYRTEPVAYHRLGAALLKGEFAQLSTEYNEKYGAKQSSAEQKAMFDRINQVIERAIDAYARAVALSTTPQQQEAKNKVLAQLTALYKSAHGGSEAGLPELIAGVLAKPFP